MANDILRNHWKYQTSWTDGFTCTHVKLQPKPSSSYTLPKKRFVYARRKSQSPEPRNRFQNDSRPVSRKSTARGNKHQTTPLQMLQDRREQRANRVKPWTEKTQLKQKNKNTFIETHYENCLPPDIDLEELKLNSRKFVANSRYGNIYQIRYDIKLIFSERYSLSDKGSNEKEEVPVTWLWEKDYKVWLQDNQRTSSGRSTPVAPTYKSTPTAREGVKLDHLASRSEAGYYSINTKPKQSIGSAGSTPRLGQSQTDKPNAELFAHYNSYRLNKQERRTAAIKIQTRFRGYKIRYRLDKLKRKAVLDHGRSWKNFVKEYKELIVRIQSRYGLMKHSCPIVLQEIENFMDTKNKYEKEFYKLATREKLMKEDVPLFLKNCDLYPTDKDITTAFNTIFKGDGNIAEVVFVLDCSTSIGPIGFRRLMQFVKDVISILEIGPDRVRVGVLPYNEDIFQSFNISTNSTKHDILNALDGIRLKHGLTRTDLAIKEMTNMLSNSRPGVKKIGIVVTDGKSSEPQITEWEAKIAQNDGIDVFAIGVGENADKNELLSIASSDTNIRIVSSYNNLADLTITVANATRSVSDDTKNKERTWLHGRSRPLTKSESMEILWTLYPPPAANLSHVRKSRWIRPIIQGTEAWSLLDKKTKDATGMQTCLRVVIQSRIDRNGHVILPSKEDKFGVEYITNVDEAVAFIEDWIKLKQDNNDGLEDLLS